VIAYVVATLSSPHYEFQKQSDRRQVVALFLRKLCPKRNENQDLKRPVAVMLILFPIDSMGVSVLALMMRKTMMSTLTLG
jgi:hypothetical protein